MAEEGIITSWMEFAIWPVYVALAGIILTAIRFNQTQRQTKKLEFMKQIQYYEERIIRLPTSKKFPITFNDCKRYAIDWLIVLDNISYLKSKKIINDEFIEYFQAFFNEGKTYLNWLELTSPDNITYSTQFRFFREIKNGIKYTAETIAISSKFYYYARQVNDVPNYIPYEDKTDPDTYTVKDDDIDLLKTES